MNYKLFESLGLGNLDLSIILIILMMFTIFSMTIAIVALTKYNNLNKKYTKFMGGNDAKALESYLMELISLNKDNEEKIEENKAEIENLYRRQRYNFQKIGLVKYDALQEMGGNLSFALTLLDENNNGFIINSVHNIQSSYCYAKEVKEGNCSINLSNEEKKALERALKS